MKKRVLSLILIFVCGILAVSAQDIPQDMNVRKGVLLNGLTYYICHNAKTPKIADFYIAQRVGAILEEPRQRGLAHFLEHMAFNGTKNFPGEVDKPGIVAWCETVGIKFGRNLNAYTSVDQTVYNISSAPIAREGVLDSCLLILNDWSHSLLLSDKEIDKERGVIHEEWRGGRARPMQRMFDVVFPKMYEGTKYADCLPIGSIDVIDNFKYNDLRDYYHKWYRPDLQAIVIVGDFDADKVEAKVKDLFGKIPALVDPAERIYYKVGDNEKTIVAIGKDKEQTQASVSLLMKREKFPDNKKNSVDYYVSEGISRLIQMMLNDRLNELTVKENTPFISADVSDGEFWLAKTKQALEGTVVCKTDNIKGGFEAMVAELERARQNGFTPTELARAKAEVLSQIEKQYNERNKRDNRVIVQNCLSNFLDSEPLVSLDFLYPASKEILNKITLEQVNQSTREMISNKNQVILGFLPEKEGVMVPTDAEFETSLLDTQSKKYDAYVDKLASTKLIDNLRAPGKIVSEKKSKKFGMTEFKLSNGMKVYVKPTDLAADQITMTAISDGGNSLCSEKDAPNFSFISDAIKEGGLGQFDAFSLNKVLAGKNAWVAPFVGMYSEGMSGSCGVKDLKTMMELLYLNFTSPRRDNVAFKSFLEKKRASLVNRDANSNTVYGDSARHFLYGDNERIKPVKVETIDKVNYDKILQIYKERFADASDFSVVLVGNVNIDSLRSLMETYLASLPATNSKEKIKDTGVNIRKVDETDVFIRKQETSSTLVSVYVSGTVPYTPENELLADVLSQALRTVYTEKIREEKGGTYSVSTFGQLSKDPYPEALIYISFRTDPTKYPDLIPIIYTELEKMAKDGPSETIMAKIKEYLVKAYGESTRSNNYWKSTIVSYVTKNFDADSGYLQRVEKLTPKEVAQFAKKILDQKRRIEITMTTDEIK